MDQLEVDYVVKAATISFGDCLPTPTEIGDKFLPPCTAAQSVNELCIKKEAPMGRYYDELEDVYVDTLPSTSDLAATRRYLNGRSHQIANDHEEQLRKDFFIDDDDAPKTVTEMLQRIKDGKFIAPDPVVDQELYEQRPWDYRITRQLKWRDPSKPADRDGFEKATATLWNAVTDVKDTIMASEATDGLAALTAFKAQTFH